ncbi:MAG: hypothetical protein ABSE15_06765 [Candidatus Bathyarchaeia archaeon]
MNEQGMNEQGTNEQVLEKESSTHLESGRSGLDCLRAHANAVISENKIISENKKNQVLERLARMVEKQKKIDQETYRALLAALELKDTGDDIADHVIILIAELATIRNAGTGIGRLS